MRLAALLIVFAALLSVGCTSIDDDSEGASGTIVRVDDANVAVATAIPTSIPATIPTSTQVPTESPLATASPQAAPAPTDVSTATPLPVTPTVAAGVTSEADPTVTPAPAPTTEPTSAPTVTPTVEPVATPTRLPLTPDPQVSSSLGLGFPAAGADPSDADDIYPNPSYDGEVRAVRTSTGAVMAVRGGGFGTFDVVTPCHRIDRVYGVEQLTERVDVLIDPGHGGNETGAVGANGLTEADVNLWVSRRLKAELEERGFSAELTRYADHRVAIQSRAALANALQPRVFISVHHNGGFPLPFDKPGHEVYFQKGDAEAQRLGGLVFEEFDNAFGDIDLDWVANGTRGVSWRTNQRGTDLYGVLRRTPGLVSILTEAMFLSNPPEADLLAKPSIQKAEALALADAIERFFKTTDPGTGFIEGLVFQGDLGPGGGTEGCVDPVLVPQ